MDINNKKEVMAAIKDGVPCFYQYGFTFRGAVKKPISKEKALELLPKYSTGIGFYELRTDKDGNIIFNEYSENDLY